MGHDRTINYSISVSHYSVLLCYSKIECICSALVCKTRDKVNHCDDVEDADVYSDTDLGAMDEHKTIILHLLSQLKLGMDLTKVWP